MSRTFIAFMLLSGLVTVAGAAPVALVQDGGSTHSIYHAPDAPGSIRTAATELRNYLTEVTGAELEIVAEPASPMICLGDNDAARAAGLACEEIPLEGFRIVTRDPDVYILGPDTADDERTPNGGTSTGTRNGVYSFIERFLGVRWLMPGEDGDFVPQTATITIPETDLTDAPFFLNRRVPYTQERTAPVKQWWRRQGLGWSLALAHYHNWQVVGPDSFDEHPDWFAERGGVRVPPTGRYKYCVTNPGLVEAFARKAIEHFDNNPASTCFSLSPSDSAGWCECEDCAALYETDPNGDLSVTPAIIHFYNDVAEIVAEKHPDKLLAGYVYAAYVFPPQEPIKLHPSVFLVWAPSFDYGFTLFKPALQKQWEDLAAQWTQVTENIAYYDLPNCVHNAMGATNPPGVKILDFLYPRLKRFKMKGVYVYGNQAWGHSGPMNYLLAKLAWDPDADIDALLDEFCEKAYAEGAPEMKQFYRMLDAETERFFLENDAESYTLTTTRMADVYAKNFPLMEQLYRDAEARITDPDAKVRLEWMGMNLTVLHWNLRQFKMLPEPEASSFHMADADFFAFLAANQDSLALYPTPATKTPAEVKEKYSVAPVGAAANAEPVKPCTLRGDQHAILRPTGTDAVTIRFPYISSRGTLLRYAVYDSVASQVANGIVSKEVPVELIAEDSEYFHLIVTAGSAMFQMTVEGADWALSGNVSDKGLHVLNKVTPAYFVVPEDTDSFRLQLEATPPGETALGKLYAPDGSLAAEFDCQAVSVDRQEIPVAAGQAGLWKLVIEQAPVGVIDDVWMKTGAGLSGFFSLDPEHALSVTVEK